MASNKKLENMMVNAFNHLDKTKDVAKVVVSHSTQIPDANISNEMLRSSLELIDTVELAKFFTVNRSSNMKDNLAFTMKVLKRNIEECGKLKDSQHCKDIARMAMRTNQETMNQLLKLYREL